MKRGQIEASQGGASVYVHGGDEDSQPRLVSYGRNVLAISAPSGTGKSRIISLLAQRDKDRYVLADKGVVRDPTEMELTGNIPYNKVELGDILRCNEPCICTVNVRFDFEAQRQWHYWMKKMKLRQRGVIEPEIEEAASYAGVFTNYYLARRILEQQQEAEDKGKVLVFEACQGLEGALAKIFPNMVVVRPYASRQTRVNRLLQRYKPCNRKEQVIASLKVLNSMSVKIRAKKITAVCRLVKNETPQDAERIVALIEELLMKPGQTSVSRRGMSALEMAL